MFKKFFMNKVIINGVTIITNGKGNVVVKNGKVYVDDILQDTNNMKEINISIEGDVKNLEVDVCNKVSVCGNIGSISTSSGDVEVSGDVSYGIKCSSGDVEVEGCVNGDIQTSSGDVKCGPVSGNVKTKSGDIKNKKNKT